MWEWFRGDDPRWRFCDLFVCTSHFTEQVVRSYGWRNTVYVGVWPLHLAAFPARSISGPARLFIHNAGLVDADDRKGTRDTILAFKRVARRDLKLIVRMQKAVPLPPLDERIKVQIGNFTNHADLYAIGDVAIQPSKMEGIGFMVIEPICSGMPVITTDYPPMSEYVTQLPMRVRKRWFERRAFATSWVKHAHLRLPSISDLARKIARCAEQDMAPVANENRRWAESMLDPERLRALWKNALEASLLLRK